MQSVKSLQKYALALLCSVFFISVPFGLVTAAPNLIENSSFENEEGEMPLNWTFAGYGSNLRIFTHASSSAFDGYRFGKVEMSEYEDGDAKWVFDSVAVIPGKTYTYGDYYKSNVLSRVVVNYDSDVCPDEEQECFYEDLGFSNPENNWTAFQKNFVIPAGVSSLTIFRLIESVGYLDIDAVMLREADEITVTDLVPNYSLSASDFEGFPLAWYGASYGSNNAIFEYIDSEGYDDTYSVKVTVANYESGDAKWRYEPQRVAPGLDYKFSAWYKTNAVPHVVAEYTKTNGQITYFGLPRPEPSGDDWQKYSAEFSVPLDVERVTVFFYLNENGWVQTDRYQIKPYVYEGFERPIVTITFDDGAEANYNTVLPLVNSLGILTTHCFATEYIAGNPTQIERLTALFDAGHEICSHTVTHPDLTTLTAADLEFELRASKDYLESIIGVTVPNIATPFGAYNKQVNNKIKEIYSSHRTVDEGYNSKDNLDIYRLKVQNMKPTTTLAEFQEWVHKAIATNTWLILVYHDVNSEDVGVTPYGTYTNDFAEQMNWLASIGVTVKTYQAALDELLSIPIAVCQEGQTLQNDICVTIKIEKPIKSLGGGRGGGTRAKKDVSAEIVPGTVLGTSTVALPATSIIIDDLKIGQFGDSVAGLQKRLMQEGFYFGPITGYFGTLTQDAVKRFQTANNIYATGEVNQSTKNTLNILSIKTMTLEQLIQFLHYLEAKLRLIKLS